MGQSVKGKTNAAGWLQVLPPCFPWQLFQEMESHIGTRIKTDDTDKIMFKM